MSAKKRSAHHFVCDEERNDIDCEIVESVNALIRALLFRDQSKEAFKKTDIVRLALDRPRVEPEVWSFMEKKLKDTLGLVLVNLQETGSMILVKEKRHTVLVPSAQLKTSLHDGLLVVVLGTIFMAGGVIEEASLMLMLVTLNITPDTMVNMPGNRKVSVDNLINSIWKKTMYLEIIEIHKPARMKKFRWGERADIEISKKDILGIMARIMDSSVEQWKEQYRVAYGGVDVNMNHSSR